MLFFFFFFWWEVILFFIHQSQSEYNLHDATLLESTHFTY